MYYPCSENKGADQPRGYREADLRLCFRICKKPVFSRRGIFHRRGRSVVRGEEVGNVISSSSQIFDHVIFSSPEPKSNKASL